MSLHELKLFDMNILKTIFWFLMSILDFIPDQSKPVYYVRYTYFICNKKVSILRTAFVFYLYSIKS